jgi:hypothetical protein
MAAQTAEKERNPWVGVGLAADAISRALNDTYADMPRELVDRRRIDKIGEEFGEVIEALNGRWAENPRKGNSHTVEDVVRELLDVALCALAATAHMTEHRHDVGVLLDQHALRVRDRLLAAIDRSE